ncbi:uncharacterized protein F5891DRAFT_1245376 [Suillus fuscotomentosus]|uniref:Uncharacterized protein n=1 Tax=Suillus fuscotomentosus TaxID=1912939 RepID=A0AAD4DZD2_9AGAM|nr:uncharacterized protein F5891DRAFT_1245376 [Suillus fuscotomentosus]KAG1896918.1 hypothetical protein F5891DRAFT_1245376 [Suillus fuscotomentosus]
MLFGARHCGVSTMRARGCYLSPVPTFINASYVMAHLRCLGRKPLKHHQSTAKQLEFLAIAQLAAAEDDNDELLGLALAALAADHRWKSLSKKYGIHGEYNQPKSKDFFDILLGHSSERQFKAWFTASPSASSFRSAWLSWFSASFKISSSEFPEVRLLPSPDLPPVPLTTFDFRTGKGSELSTPLFEALGFGVIVPPACADFGVACEFLLVSMQGHPVKKLMAKQTQLSRSRANEAAHHNLCSEEAVYVHEAWALA